MTFTDEDRKEIWSNNKIIEEFHYNLVSIKGENGLRKYEELAKYLLYRIPIWRKPETGNKQPPDFAVEIKDVLEKVKEHLAYVAKTERIDIVKEAVCILFENLGPKEKEYFNKNVRHLLKVRFV